MFAPALPTHATERRLYPRIVIGANHPHRFGFPPMPGAVDEGWKPATIPARARVESVRAASPRRGWSSLVCMNFDFRFRDENGDWRSAGHHKGSDRAEALQGLAKRNGGPMPAGRYMSRPRGRQRDWDLFVIDDEGNIGQAD